LRRIALPAAQRAMENFVPAVWKIAIRPVGIADERGLRSIKRRAEEAEGARRGYSTGA